MLKLLFKLFIVVVVGLLLTAGYLGFIPGLSSVMGADNPKDLGITYTEQDYENMLTKSNIIQNEALEISEEIGVAYDGTHDLNTNFSGQDLTALINASKWKYNPFTNVQIRINRDGTAEVSGNVNLSKFWNYVGIFGVNTSAIDQGKKALAMLPNQPAFYAKGVAAGTDNRVSSLNVESLTIGRVTVPNNIIQENQHYLTEMADRVMSSVPGFYAKKANIENGSVVFEGQVPDKLSIATE